MKIFAITENCKLLLVQVFLCLFAFLPCLSFAQNSSIEKEELQKIIEGKTFWFHPNSNVFNRCRKVQFHEIGQKLNFDFQSLLKFNFEFVESDLKVKINELINATTKIEFIEKNMFVYENDIQYLNICFSDLSPAEHALKLQQIQKNEEDRIANNRKQTQKAEEERIAKNRKGGVRIGMTAKHVREKTDWGEPKSINATITSSGRREQWVYGDGDYLYFRNGILDAIQVRN
jgi:hypothetical protein